LGLEVGTAGAGVPPMGQCTFGMSNGVAAKRSATAMTSSDATNRKTEDRRRPRREPRRRLRRLARGRTSGCPGCRDPAPRASGVTTWVTRARPKVDRIACPWLIRRFVDPGAAGQAQNRGAAEVELLNHGVSKLADDDGRLRPDASRPFLGIVDAASNRTRDQARNRPQNPRRCARRSAGACSRTRRCSDYGRIGHGFENHLPPGHRVVCAGSRTRPFGRR
jgi:hypothetical protein